MHAGELGSLSRCRASAADVTDSLQSFPSGHAAISTAGLLYLCRYLRVLLQVRRGVYISVGSLLSSAPLLLAAYISVSRVRDRYHNTDDVVAGVALGALAATVSWQHNMILRGSATSTSNSPGPASQHRDVQQLDAVTLRSPHESASATDSELPQRGNISSELPAAAASLSGDKSESSLCPLAPCVTPAGRPHGLLSAASTSSPD